MKIKGLAPIRRLGNSGIGRPHFNAPKVKTHFNKAGYMKKFVKSHSSLKRSRIISF